MVKGVDSVHWRPIVIHKSELCCTCELVVNFEEGLGIYLAQRLGELKGASAEEIKLWTPYRTKLGLFITYLNETWVGSGQVPVEPNFLLSMLPCCKYLQVFTTL